MAGVDVCAENCSLASEWDHCSPSSRGESATWQCWFASAGEVFGTEKPLVPTVSANNGNYRGSVLIIVCNPALLSVFWPLFWQLGDVLCFEQFNLQIFCQIWHQLKSQRQSNLLHFPDNILLFSLRENVALINFMRLEKSFHGVLAKISLRLSCFRWFWD